MTGAGDDSFDGYSDQVWEGILSNQAVTDHKNLVSIKAFTLNECCKSYEERLPKRRLVNKSSFFNVTLASLEAGFAIGSGSLDVGETLLKVDCDEKWCHFNADMDFTVTDKYSFKKFDDAGNELPWWHWDNNWFLRTFFLLDVWGKDFDTSDIRSYNFGGTYACKP